MQQKGDQHTKKGKSKFTTSVTLALLRTLSILTKELFVHKSQLPMSLSTICNISAAMRAEKFPNHPINI